MKLRRAAALRGGNGPFGLSGTRKRCRLRTMCLMQDSYWKRKAVGQAVSGGGARRGETDREKKGVG